MSDADRRDVERLIAEEGSPGAGLMRPVAAFVLGVVLMIGAFVIVRNPQAGPLVLVAALMILVGAALWGFGVWIGAFALARAREALQTRADLVRACEGGVVEVIEIVGDAAFLVSGVDDLDHVLFRVGPGEFAWAPWLDFDATGAEKSVPGAWVVRVLPGEERSVLSAHPSGDHVLTLRSDVAHEGKLWSVITATAVGSVLNLKAFPRRVQGVLVRP